MDLQGHFTPFQSNQMSERRLVIEGTLKESLQSLLMQTPGLSELRVDASSGIGNNSVIPWVRIYDVKHSPSPQSGWYLVFLFSRDGEHCYLSLDLGVTHLSKDEIAKERNRAKRALEYKGIWPTSDSVFLEQINLGAGGNQLARKYEQGNLLALKIAKGSVLEDSQLISAIEDLEILRKVVSEGWQNEKSSDSLSPQNLSDELDALVEQIGWHRDRIAEVLESIKDSTPQVVLYGPPGTGKTFVAQKFAEFLLSHSSGLEVQDRIKIVQFHPSYGYEEFVEGIRPVVDQQNQMRFEPVEGVILEMARAIEADGHERVLIIDEMNRANLPRVFGELLFLLEYRDKEIDLMFSKSFALPKGLLIIGTMNTADKSIKFLDSALRRRFDFFSLEPDVQVLRRHYQSKRNSLGDALFDGLEALNNKLRSDVGEKGYEIGHSYFMRDKMDRRTLQVIWERQIIPLISDYFSDRWEVIETYQLGTFWPDA